MPPDPSYSFPRENLHLNNLNISSRLRRLSPLYPCPCTLITVRNLPTHSYVSLLLQTSSNLTPTSYFPIECIISSPRPSFHTDTRYSGLLTLWEVHSPPAAQVRTDEISVGSLGCPGTNPNYSSLVCLPEEVTNDRYGEPRRCVKDAKKWGRKGIYTVSKSDPRLPGEVVRVRCHCCNKIVYRNGRCFLQHLIEFCPHSFDVKKVNVIRAEVARAVIVPVSAFDWDDEEDGGVMAKVIGAVRYPILRLFRAAKFTPIRNLFRYLHPSRPPESFEPEYHTRLDIRKRPSHSSRTRPEFTNHLNPSTCTEYKGAITCRSSGWRRARKGIKIRYQLPLTRDYELMRGKEKMKRATWCERHPFRGTARRMWRKCKKGGEKMNNWSNMTKDAVKRWKIGVEMEQVMTGVLAQGGKRECAECKANEENEERIRRVRDEALAWDIERRKMTRRE